MKVGFCFVGQYLEQIGSDLLVCAVPSQLLGQLRDPLAGVGQRLRARYQLALCAFPSTDQLAGIRHDLQMNWLNFGRSLKIFQATQSDYEVTLGAPSSRQFSWPLQ